MERLFKLTSKEVNKDGDFVLLIDEDAYYGSLDYLKDVIKKQLGEGVGVDEMVLGRFDVLKNSQINSYRNVNISQSSVDEEYENLEEAYEIHVRGIVYDKEYDLQSAIHTIERIIEEDEELDADCDDVQLIRKVTYGCTYEPTVEHEVEFYIPPQPEYEEVETIQTGGIDWESKPTAVLMQELSKIQEILNKRLTIEE